LNWFKREYRVVEVERPRAELTELPEMREGLKALSSNPYVEWLVGRLKAQKNNLETRLKATRFDRVEDVSFVQSGVFWTGWLERELERLTAAPQKPELPPYEKELEAFREIDALLERVGLDNEAQ
jgi:hypothetical protein